MPSNLGDDRGSLSMTEQLSRLLRLVQLLQRRPRVLADVGALADRQDVPVVALAG